MTLSLTKPMAENFVQLSNVSWETFNHLLAELGDKRNQLLTYYSGILEIMTPFGEHENNNRFIESLISVIADELNLNLKKLGSLTLKSNEFKQAVEPDSCYYLQNEPKVRNKQNIDLSIDPPPDLVLEIDITSGSLNKLPIYANLKIPEIWRYDGKNLTVFVLQPTDNSYRQVDKSKAFSFFYLNLVPELIQQSLEEGETATLKQFRQWVRDNTQSL